MKTATLSTYVTTPDSSIIYYTKDIEDKLATLEKGKSVYVVSLCWDNNECIGVTISSATNLIDFQYESSHPMNIYHHVNLIFPENDLKPIYTYFIDSKHPEKCNRFTHVNFFKDYESAQDLYNEYIDNIFKHKPINKIKNHINALKEIIVSLKNRITEIENQGDTEWWSNGNEYKQTYKDFCDTFIKSTIIEDKEEKQ